MKILFLFYTQAEGGAPGYLSQKGEKAAENLAETISQFVQQELEINIAEKFSMRAQSLNGDLRWRTFKEQDSLKQAVRSALTLFPDILLLCGAQTRTLKTTTLLASQLALPVCVDERADKTSVEKPSNGSLQNTLENFSESWVVGAEPPRLVLVGTSLAALLEWLKSTMTSEKVLGTEDVLVKVTEGDTLPTVFVCGYEIQERSSLATWIFD